MTTTLKEDDSLKCLTPADLTTVVASSFFITPMKKEPEVNELSAKANRGKNLNVFSIEVEHKEPIHGVYLKVEPPNPEQVYIKEEARSPIQRSTNRAAKIAFYECALCDFKCGHKVKLRKHILTHAGEKPFKPDCECGNKTNERVRDRIKQLLEKPFRLLDYDEKLAVVRSEIPQPALSDLKANHKEKDRSYMRSFNVSNYQKYKWLTGSVRLQKLFCWPCLLFSTEIGPWNTDGFKNLNYLSSACDKHGKSMGHIKSCALLQTFGTPRLDYNLSLQNKITDGLHNRKVKENRDVLRRLIDVAGFLGGRNEVGQTTYVELLDFLAPYDWVLANHLKSGPSSFLRDDVIDAIAGVVDDQIALEVSRASFVALLLDETSDVYNKSRLATVIRYVDGEGHGQERFLHFTDCGCNRTGMDFSEHISNVVEGLGCSDKFVGLTCNGASVPPNQLAELQSALQNKYPTATFVHNQRLTSNLAQSMMYFKECRGFFTSLSALRSFFLHSTPRVDAWRRFLKNNHVNFAPTDWTSSSSLLETLRNNRLLFKDFFESIEDEPDDWGPGEALAASGFVRFLSKPDTKLLLSVFHPAFSLVDALSEALQEKNMNPSFCACKVDEVYDELQQVRVEGCRESDEGDDGEPKTKRKRVKIDRQIFDEILETLMGQVQLRCGSQRSLKFVSLLDCSNFSAFNMVFPDNLFVELGEPYGGFFDKVRLRNELKVLWGADEYRDKSVGELTVYLKLNKLDVVFGEVYKLAELVGTFPSTTGMVEKAAFERIRGYLRVNKEDVPSRNLAMLSIEKDIIVNFKKYAEESYYGKVTSKFTQKDRRLEFMYK